MLEPDYTYLISQRWSDVGGLGTALSEPVNTIGFSSSFHWPGDARLETQVGIA